MSTIATALIVAGYRLKAVTAAAEYFTRGENESVAALATGRVLFHNADGDGQWVTTEEAIARVAA